MTHLDVIGLWPSITALAKSLQRPAATVFSWKHRGEIPPARFGEVVKAAKAAGFEGVTLEVLYAGASPRTGEAA